MDCNFTSAIVRAPAPTAGRGLTTASLGLPDYERLSAQHLAYVQTLQAAGLEVTWLDPLPEFPDAYFVEDVAVISTAVAVLTRPGAPQRRGEVHSIQAALQNHRPTREIDSPATLDGGDVLAIGTDFFVGLSQRTNRAGATQLGAILQDHGYTCHSVSVAEGLHLKSSANYVGNGILLMTEELANTKAFCNYDKIIVPADEAYAANSLLVNDLLIMPKGFPKTRQLLEPLNRKIVELDVSEVRKMDGGLTCLSLRF